LSIFIVAEATVLKLYPGRLHVAVTERQAFALWQKDGEVTGMSEDGGGVGAGGGATATSQRFPGGAGQVVVEGLVM